LTDQCGFTDWSIDGADRATAEMRIPLDPVHNNLVDAVWNEASGRPSFSHRPAFVHDVAYAGNEQYFLKF
jgi:hypothetical protein